MALHLSVYARDPDGIAVEIVWRIPHADWAGQHLWRKPLDFAAARPRWGAAVTTGSDAGQAACARRGPLPRQDMSDSGLQPASSKRRQLSIQEQLTPAHLHPCVRVRTAAPRPGG